MILIETCSSYTMFMSLILILFCQETTAAIIATYEGGTATLTCTESPTIYPEWAGPHVDRYNYDTDSVFANPALGEKASRLSWDPTNNKSLVINNVMKNDTGTYKCSYTMNRELTSSMQDLSVRVLPLAPVIRNTETLNGTRTVVRGTEGQELTLECTSTGGYPEPLLYWYKVNTQTQTQPLDTTKTSQEGNDGTFTVVATYTFTPSNQDDDVTFVCQSSFSPPQPSEQRVQVKLLLNLKPSPPVVTSYPVVEDVSGKVADCRTAQFRPDNIDVWFQMNGNNVPSNIAITGDTGQTFSAVASYTATLQRQQNGKPLVCNVAHQTLQTPLNGSGTTNVRFRPLTASLTGSVSNIVADSNAKISLTCTSGSSNPKSTITWHRNGVQIPNPAPVTETNGDYNGVVTSQIYEFVPNRSMDGERVNCTVHNSIEGQPPVQSETKTLNLLYHPIVTLSGNPEVEEGNTTILKCTVDSKPKSTVTWYHNAEALPAGGTIVSDSLFEYRINITNRNNTGTYKCAANNGYEPSGEKETGLLVQYAPDVVVASSNVTVNDTEAELTCFPSGVPDTYIYSVWEHIWPGYGVLPHSGLGNSPILKLSSLSYEYSGIYKCSASNGVTGSLNPNAGNGETYLQVETFPIITTPNSMKISSQLNNPTTFPLEFYSNSISNTVECFRTSTKWNVSSSIEDRTITLPVFDTTITTMGFVAKVSLFVTHMDHFGVFTCRISNAIGAQTVNVDIVPEGPPEAPYSVLIEDVQSSSVTISWLPGFHGGFNQTFTIEYRNRADEWLHLNITGGQHENRFNKTIRGLQTGTKYFIRIKSVNERGTSDYSYTLNATTKVIETTSPTSNLTGIVAGASAGVVVFALVGIVAFIVIRKRKSKSNDNETGRQSLYRAEPANAGDGMTINAAYVSTDSFRVQPTQNTSNGTAIYAEVDKTKKTGMNNENNTYAVVNKPKKEGKLVEEQNQKKGKTDKGKGKKGKKGKPGKRTGTNVYENAQELNVYGNIGQHNDVPEENTYENREEESPKRNLNKDGLIYADLMFENNNTGQRKLIIHGLENGTEYVKVDFNRKAEPLPDSDEEDGDK